MSQKLTIQMENTWIDDFKLSHHVRDRWLLETEIKACSFHNTSNNNIE